MPIFALIFGEDSASGAAFDAAMDKARFGRAAPGGPVGLWPVADGALYGFRCGSTLVVSNVGYPARLPVASLGDR